MIDGCGGTGGACIDVKVAYDVVVVDDLDGSAGEVGVDAGTLVL